MPPSQTQEAEIRSPTWVLDLLTPHTPDDRRALYELIVDELLRNGFDWTVARRLALATVDHLEGHGARVLMTGDGLAHSTALVRSLATLLELPYVEIDAGGLAETNWQGADLPWHLARLRDRLGQAYPPASVPALAERAVVHIHHLERLRLPGHYRGSATTGDYRAGKQTSILPLFEGTPIPVDLGSGKGFTWSGRRALVIASATFRGLPPRPHADDLADWGLMPELAEALATCTALRIERPSTQAVARAIHDGIRKIQARFLAFGFRLEVAPQVIRYVRDALTSGLYPGGADIAIRWMKDACEVALTRLLEEGAPPFTTHVLAVDDLSLPPAPKGIWRE